MRTRRPAGGSDFGDLLAADDQIAFLDVQARRMGVAAGESIAVIDLDHITILGMPLRGDDLAARSGEHRGALVAVEVDSFMERLAAGERIDPVTEIGAE